MRFPPVIPSDIIINKLFSEGFTPDKLPHISFSATLPTHYYDYVVANGFGDFARPSSYIGYIHTDRVMAHTRKSNLI